MSAATRQLPFAAGMMRLAFGRRGSIEVERAEFRRNHAVAFGHARDIAGDITELFALQTIRHGVRKFGMAAGAVPIAMIDIGGFVFIAAILLRVGRARPDGRAAMPEAHPVEHCVRQKSRICHAALKLPSHRHDALGRHARAGVHNHESRVLLRISDSGSGIAEADLPHVFDRFYRAADAPLDAAPRIGLGLAISKRMLERHDGDITVESRLGERSCFSFSLERANSSRSA